MPWDMSGGAAIGTTVPNIASLDGATRFVLAFNMSRAGTWVNNQAVMGRANVPNATEGVYIRGNAANNMECVIGEVGQVNRGRVAISDTDDHHYVIQFDGTQSTNATRLRLWVDGVDVGFDAFSFTIPTSVTAISGGAPDENFGIGRLPGVSGNLLTIQSQVALWVGIADIGQSFVNAARRGCANLLFPSFLELDTALNADPAIDRSPTPQTMTTSGTPVVTSTEPPWVTPRGSCTSGIIPLLE